MDDHCIRLILSVVVGCGMVACRSDGGNDNTPSSDDDDNAFIPDEPVSGLSDDGCSSVRMTQYGASERGWCGFDRTHPVLPEFVREGMTVAIAEPYNGSTYGGEPGEACGECFEVSTTFATTLVMVHDLCPIEGNPICAGSYFHFDVSNETAEALGGGWLGEAALRRVPCAVTDNIYIYITARNEYGYLQLSFFNHRFPIRKVEYSALDSDVWQPMERCLARWCLDNDTATFSDDGPGGVFRLTSAAGETIESTNVLTYSVPEGADFDTGIQFEAVTPATGTCEFTPPGDVYDDEWGGIDGVTWEPNTWGETTLSEIENNCANDSGSCLLLDNFEGSGLHITYRHVFPVDTFETLSLAMRTVSGAGVVQVAPRTEDARCSVSTFADVAETWSSVTIDLAESCPDTDDIHGLTISLPSGALDVVVDEIFFE